MTTCKNNGFEMFIAGIVVTLGFTALTVYVAFEITDFNGYVEYRNIQTCNDLK